MNILLAEPAIVDLRTGTGKHTEALLSTLLAAIRLKPCGQGTGARRNGLTVSVVLSVPDPIRTTTTDGTPPPLEGAELHFIMLCLLDSHVTTSIVVDSSRMDKRAAGFLKSSNLTHMHKLRVENESH